VVTRLGAADLLRQSRRAGMEIKERLRNRETDGVLRYLLYLVKDALKLSLDASKWVLPMGIFLFQFLQWWQHEPRLESGSKSILPPPEAPRLAGRLTLPQDKSHCAICRKSRTNPAAATSGVLYCYPCLKQEVEEHGCCPVTGMPMQVEQIRRIYDDQPQTQQ